MVILVNCREGITNILIPTNGEFTDPKLQYEATEGNKILLELFDIYVYVIPTEMILGAFVAFIRALGQQNTFIYCQLIVFYAFHMGALYVFLWHTKLQAKGLVINLG